MYMKNWADEVDEILEMRHYDVLSNNGKISHKKALEKATDEYKKFEKVQDQNYISDFDKLVCETKYLSDKGNNFNK